MRLLTATAIYVATTSGALADAAMMGAGTSTCAEFAQEYRANRDFVMFHYFGWAQGFMSATNILKRAVNQPQRDLHGLPTAEQMDRLRDFCDKRPLAHFGDGVIELFYQLPEISP